MGAEDFSYMLLVKPGCYAFIGNGEGQHRDIGHGAGPCMLHNPSYDFNDALLPLGATSVSYTHLDVYKRQSSGRVNYRLKTSRHKSALKA